MRARHLLTDARLQAQPQRSHEAANGPHSNPGGAVGLTLVRSTLFCRKGLQALDLELHHHQNLRDERQQGYLLITLEDESDVAHPADVRHQEIRYVLVFVRSLARDEVRERVVRLKTTYNDALDDAASLSGSC